MFDIGLFNRLTIQLDLTNFCNLSCIMCASGGYRKKKFMKRSLFEKIAKDIVTDFPNAPVRVHMHGESTIHPEISEFLTLFAGLRNQYGTNNVIEISTNGQYEENLNGLFTDSGLVHSVTFSVDASDAETYQKIRRGGDYPHLLRNIGSLMALVSGSEKNLPFIYVQFIVMDENYHQVDDFVNKFSSMFQGNGLETGIEKDYFFEIPDRNRIILLRRIVGEDYGSMDEQKYFDDLHSRAVAKYFPAGPVESKNLSVRAPVQFRYPCPGLWLYIGIHPDGKVSPCCQDHDSRFVLGDLTCQHLKDIWFGKTIEKIRLEQVEGKFTSACHDCTNQIEAGFSDKELEEYILKTQQPEYFQRFLDRKNQGVSAGSAP